MKLPIALAAVWIGFALPVCATANEDLTVAGKVVDAAGKPAAGVEIASFWDSHNNSMHAFQGTTSDENGRFSLKVPSYGRSVALLAFDRDRKNGGILIVKTGENGGGWLRQMDKVFSPRNLVAGLAHLLANGGAAGEQKSIGKDRTITLGPLVRVKGDFSCKELNQKPTWTNVYFMTADGARVLQCASREATFSFLLPAGKYQFWGYGADIKDVHQDLTVSADKAELNLQTLDVPATVIAKHKGKTPPAWHVTDARGVKKDVTLADFKGKWVLVEFWGFW